MKNLSKFNPHKLSTNEQEQLRFKIVRRVLEHGNRRQAANECECSLSHVNHTMAKWH